MAKKRSSRYKEEKKTTKIRREQYRKRQRNKKIINYSVLFVAILLVAYGIYLSVKPEGPGPQDDLARCLTENGVIMYGTDWCPHCQEQKQRFGTSFKYVNYVNCDLNPAACELAGITGYPTWIFPSGERASGTQRLESLAERARCGI